MKDTPMFPDIARSENEPPPPFVPYVMFPTAAMRDTRLQRSELSVLHVVVNDCNGMIDGRPGRKVESLLTNEQIGERAAVAFGSVKRALGKLADCGYLERFSDDHAKGRPRCLRPLFRTLGPPSPGESKWVAGPHSEPEGGRASGPRGGAPVGRGGARQWAEGGRASGPRPYRGSRAD